MKQRDLPKVGHRGAGYYDRSIHCPYCDSMSVKIFSFFWRVRWKCVHCKRKFIRLQHD